MILVNASDAYRTKVQYRGCVSDANLPHGISDGELLPLTTVTSAKVVYIVEDDDSVRTGLSRLMRSAGYEPRAFASPSAFLEAICAEQAACILLDITMPQVSGFQVQAQLGKKGISLPVIAVSARDDDEARGMARALGAQFFLRKPVDDRALLDAIDWVTNSNNGG